MIELLLDLACSLYANNHPHRHYDPTYLVMLGASEGTRLGTSEGIDEGTSEATREGPSAGKLVLCCVGKSEGPPDGVLLDGQDCCTLGVSDLASLPSGLG